MRILIFGATGGTGRQLVQQALERRYEVTAFVRDPARLPLRDPLLRVVQGDVQRAETIQAAVPHHQAVLSALGSISFGPTTLLSAAAQEIVRAMQTHSVKRLLWESALGIGETKGQLGPLYNWLLIPFLLRHAFADKERQEQIVRSSALDWTIVQPAALTNGSRTGAYRAGRRACAGGLFPRISRADVAHFMLGELTARAYVRQTVALCY
jgi:putative NADH-flavin reductase